MPTNGKRRIRGENSSSKARKLRRRTLLGSIGTVGVGALAGCSGGDGGGDSGDGGGDSGGDGSGGDSGGDGSGGDGGGSSGPDLSQYLITDINGNSPSLDPHAIDSTANTAWGGFPMNAYETLLFYEPGESTLQPVLAEEVPTVDNGLITNNNRTFEFPLRQGVQFHTGGEMTSEDVKYSIDRVRTMNLTGGAGLDRIESLLGEDPLDGPAGLAPAPPEPLVLTAVEYPPVDFEPDASALASARDVFGSNAIDYRTNARVASTIAEGIDREQ